MTASVEVTARPAATTAPPAAKLTVTVVPPGTPMAIAFEPPTAKIPDNSPAGFVIAKAVITTAGGPFAGTLAIAGDPIFAVNGMNIVLARALTPADDGTHNATVTAATPTHALVARFAV
jgi:hypothetical protein